MPTKRGKSRSRRGRRGPGIADVARVAGVSMMSVSRVINGKPGVGNEVHRRVLAAMEELGFQPNAAPGRCGPEGPRPSG
jgi:hypothetical protein